MGVLEATPIGRGLLRSVGQIILMLSCATASSVIPPKSTLLPTKSNFAATQGTPSFSIRLSNETSQVCNSSTPGVSGFIDSNIGDDESHMFFWLFDSKNDPSSDPLILWMTGGPGASSTGYGNLMELGPCRIAPEGGYTIENEFGWNKNATVLFVEDEDPAQRPLSRGVLESIQQINLKGVMIGNGLVRQPVQNPGTFEALCSGPNGLFNTSQCLEWAPRVLWCEKNLGVCETKGWTSSECKSAQKLCSEMAEFAINEMHHNPYDWRRTCGDDPLGCYPEMAHIDNFLNSSIVKKALGVPEEAPFFGVSFDVFNLWEEIGDLWKSSAEYVNYLLNSGIRVLIYVGDKDLYCNAAGMRRLVNEGLEWNGHPFFRFREYLPWYHDSKRVGRWKSYDSLTYAEIFDCAVRFTGGSSVACIGLAG
ncbi:PRC1-Carboxypeptidase y serine-type protease [Colletotrichum asianum]